MVSGTNQSVSLGGQTPPVLTVAERSEIQYLSFTMTGILAKDDSVWLQSQTELVSSIRKIWNSDAFHEKHHKSNTVDYTLWKEPKVVAEILLEYFKGHQDSEILLLFQLLRAFCGRFLADFQFLKEYLENEVSKRWPHIAGWHLNKQEHHGLESCHSTLFFIYLSLIVLRWRKQTSLEELCSLVFVCKPIAFLPRVNLYVKLVRR